jgi:hypothetical protein
MHPSAVAALTSRGLGHISNTAYPRDFEFIVGPNRFLCHSFIADFLSPKLARVHECDPTFLSYRVKTADPDHLFEKFLSLGYGGSFQFSSVKGLDFFRALAIELENPEFCFLLFEYLNTELTPETVVERLRAREGFDHPIDSEIAFIAQNFCTISPIELAQLTFEELERVISRPDLKIGTEDQLMEFLGSRITNVPKSFSF